MRHCLLKFSYYASSGVFLGAHDDIDFVVDKCLVLATNNFGDDAKKAYFHPLQNLSSRIFRCNALAALNAYAILYELNDDLDGFLNRDSRIVYCYLVNMFEKSTAKYLHFLIALFFCQRSD